MKGVWIGLTFIALTAAQTAPARADCQCVAAGKKYQVGEVACLSLPEGNRLARCGMVLNNSSWTKLQDSCPVAFLADPGSAVGHAHADSTAHLHATPDQRLAETPARDQ